MIYTLEKTKKPLNKKVQYRRIINREIKDTELTDFLFKGATGNFAISFPAIIKFKKDGDIFTFVNQQDSTILDKIEKIGTYRLKENQVVTGIDVHQDFVIQKHLKILDEQIKVGDGIFILSTKEKQSLQLTNKEEELIKPFYTTDELTRYYGNPQNKRWIIYTTTKVIKNIKEYPHIKEHLDKFKPIITSDFKPYGLHRAREESFFLGEKIISLRKTGKPCFTYTDFPCYVSQTFFVLKPDNINLKYLLGILNSTLCYFWLDKKGKKQGDALQIDKEPLLKIPIRVQKEEKLFYDLIALVDSMLNLNKKMQSAKGSEKEQIQAQINNTDIEIDNLVYKLYDITEAEKKIIEESIA